MCIIVQIPGNFGVTMLSRQKKFQLIPIKAHSSVWVADTFHHESLFWDESESYFKQKKNVCKH